MSVDQDSGWEELVHLVSSGGERFPVHVGLLCNASRVFRDVLSSTSEKEIALSETSEELKLLLNALYGVGCIPPPGLDLDGEPVSWRGVCSLAELADKFDAPRLLSSCTRYMESKVFCLEAAPSKEGMAVALEWLKLAKRLELHDVTAAVASLLGRMFFVWNLKAHLKEVSAAMDAASFLEVVNNISGGGETPLQGSQSATAPLGAQDNPASTEAVLNEQQVPVAPPTNTHAFVGTAEPLLGYHNHLHQHPMLAAQPLVPIGHW